MARTNPIESANVREARLAYERALLDEAHADLDAGRSLSGPALDRWLEAFIGDGELPSPAALRAAARR